MLVVRKKVVSGSIGPRWSKAKVAKWLEIGAIPAIAGLWLPDWVGGYANFFQTGDAYHFPKIAIPPVLTYVGALILIKVCLEGIRDMGRYYRAAQILGLSAIVLALASVPLHFAARKPDVWFALELLSIGLAAFLGGCVLWVTIAKVAEITMETRTLMTRNAVLALNSAALVTGACAVLQVLRGAPTWTGWLRAAVIFFTAAFIACRIGVHFYRTQKYIGAAFARPPEEQYWV